MRRTMVGRIVILALGRVEGQTITLAYRYAED